MDTEFAFWARITQLKQFLVVTFQLRQVPDHIVNPFDVRIEFNAIRWNDAFLEELQIKTGLASIKWSVAPLSSRTVKVVLWIPK